MPTDKQLDMLAKLGVDRSSAQKLSKEEALERIADLRSKPTPKQQGIMLRLGLTPDQINEHTVESAFEWIGQHINRRA